MSSADANYVRSLHIWLGHRSLCDRFDASDTADVDPAGVPACGACHLVAEAIMESADAIEQGSNGEFYPPSPMEALGVLEDTSWRERLNLPQIRTMLIQNDEIGDFVADGGNAR